MATNPSSSPRTACVFIADFQTGFMLIPLAAKHFQLALKATDDVFQGEHEIWVLLTRHVADTRAQSDFVSLYAESGDLLDVNAAHLKVIWGSFPYTLLLISL